MSATRNGAPTPKDRFTALDTLAIVRELRTLDRARVDKAFDLTGGGWSIAFRVPGEGRRELLLIPGRYAALLGGSVGHTQELSPFARELRRLLVGAVLQGVAEPVGERFLELHFGRGEEAAELLLAVELFGTGNVLVARNGRLAAVARPRQWAHRSVRVGAEYARPPTRTDPWTLGVDAIAAELLRSRTDLASTLAARLGLGGPIAEELIARAGLAAEAPAARDPETFAARLHAELETLLSEIGERPSGYLYRREGVAVDATPYHSRRWASSGLEETELPTFSEAAQEYFASLAGPSVSPEEAEAARRRRELDHLAGQQRAAVEELTAESERLRTGAETILAHYAEAEAAVGTARSGGEEAPRIEVPLGGRTVPLWLDRTPRESAQSLFEEAKRVGAKLSGARAALAETEQKQSQPLGPPPTLIRAPAARRTAAIHWFERFRWFISSEGAVVVGGRDAGSNDLLVKRHLKPGDIYVHADLHGAASVVVKHSEAGAPALTETTYREAGQWAVAMSKAWRAGLAAASAFWVAHDQVSKAGASGEFVARGAWVVHGTKHFMRDLPVELAIGTVDYGGTTLWSVAPPAAIHARGTVRVLITPGPERERPDREKDLVRELGLARPWLQSVLPAGGLTLRRP